MSAIINENQSFQDTGGQPLVGGFIYIGLQNLDPVLNPKPIFSDRALTVALANPQTLDSLGKSTNKIWTDGAYSMKIEDVNNVQIYEELDNGEASGIGVVGLTNVIGINAITANASPTITALRDGVIYEIEIVSANTADAVTLNIDGLGAKTIQRSFDLDVGIGRFLVGQKVLVIYNLGNDNFELVNDNRSVVLGVQGADIVSAATVDLAAATGNRLNVTGHDGPIADFGTVLVGTEFELTFPGSSPVVITSSSIASPTNILCAAVHGLTTGDEAIIADHIGSVPDINGSHTVTVIDTTNYTIAVNVTTGGTGGTSTGVPKITHNAVSNSLPGEADIVVEPGDVMRGHSLGGGNFHWTDYHSPLLLGQIPSKAEAIAGVQATKPTTSLRVQQWHDVKQFESAEQTVTINTLLTVAHGLGTIPYFVDLVLRNKTTEYSYAVGDEVRSGNFDSTTANVGVTYYADATNVYIRQGGGVYVKSATFTNVIATPASWKWVIRASLS